MVHWPCLFLWKLIDWWAKTLCIYIYLCYFKELMKLIEVELSKLILQWNGLVCSCTTMQVSDLKEGSQRVRKGAWSKFEDDLLKACVQHYGEGKWHLVPQRAGLLFFSFYFFSFSLLLLVDMNIWSILDHLNRGPYPGKIKILYMYIYNI